MCHNAKNVSHVSSRPFSNFPSGVGSQQFLLERHPSSAVTNVQDPDPSHNSAVLPLQVEHE